MRRNRAHYNVTVIILYDGLNSFVDFKIYDTYFGHDDVIKWKHSPRYWPFVRGIHRSPANSPHKRTVTRSFDVFSDLRLNKRLSKQS